MYSFASVWTRRQSVRVAYLVLWQNCEMDSISKSTKFELLRSKHSKKQNNVLESNLSVFFSLILELRTKLEFFAKPYCVYLSRTSISMHSNITFVFIMWRTSEIPVILDMDVRGVLCLRTNELIVVCFLFD